MPNRTRIVLSLALLLAAALLALPAMPAQSQGPREGVSDVGWNADGTLLAVARYDGSVEIVTPQGDLLDTLSITELHLGPILAWSPSQPNVLAVNVPRDPIQIVDISDGTRLEIEAREHVTELTWSPDGTRLASVGVSEGLIQRESAVEIWNSGTGELLAAYADGFVFVDCVWNPQNSDQVLITGIMNFAGAEFALWNSGTEQVMWSFIAPFGVTHVGWAPNGNGFVSATDTRLAGEDSAFVEIRNAATGQVSGDKLPTAIQSVTNAIWAPSEYLAIADPNLVEIWNPSTATLIASFSAQSDAIAWNPAGTHLAYVGEDNTVEIVAYFETSSISPTPAPDSEPRILYSVPSDRGITYYTMNADGSDKKEVENAFFGGDRWITALGASYSPDGHALAFGAVDREGEYRTGDLDSDTLIHVLDLENGTVTRLDTVGNSYKPLWSPDGTTIAFLADGEALHTIDMTTGMAQVMLNAVDLRDLVGMAGFVTSFDWSSDGSLLAADATMISGPEGGGYTSIFMMNSDGTDVHQTLPPGISAKYPAWGPGNDILYCVCVPDSPGARRVEICAIDLAASQINQITHFEGTPIGGISDLDVSNGDQIVFVSHPQEGNSDIYRYDLVTGALVNLTADIDVDAYAPRWVESPPAGR